MIAVSRILVFLLLASCLPVQASQKVVLQLKWEPSFQFAGYYAALWQGYYADEGLDVEIRSAFTEQGEFLEPIGQLASGQADFAIGSLDALKAKDRGLDIMIASPIYQHSPIAIYSLASTPLNSVRDLSKLRIAINAEDMASVWRALLLAQGFTADESLLLRVPKDNHDHLSPLLDGSADAIMTYSVAARMEAEGANLELNELKPSDFGLDLYGDTLITLQSLHEHNPELIESFRNASIKGWQYALDHRVEIAQKIASELPRVHYPIEDFSGFNRAFADITDEYMVYPYVPVGHSNLARWKEIVFKLKQSGALTNDWEVETLFAPEDPQSSTYWLILIATVSCILLLLAPLLFTRFRLRRAWPYMLVILFTITSNLLIRAYVDRSWQQEAKLDGTHYLNSLTTKLLETLRSHLALTDSLALYISLNPQMEQHAFEQYAASIFRMDPLLNNIAAAPDMKIQMIYPMQGNEAALGVDYRANLMQWRGVEFALQRQKASVDGPINLLQGGEAFLLHSPVLMKNGGVWGVVTAPLRTDVLLQSIGLKDSDLGWEISIRINDYQGERNRLVLGQEQLFNHPLAVDRTFNVGGRTWHLAAMPKSGQSANRRMEVPLHVGSLVLSALLIFIIGYGQRQRGKERRYQQAISENEQLLQEVGKLARIDGWKMNAAYQFVQWNSHLSKLMGVRPKFGAQPELKDLMTLLEPREAKRIENCFKQAMQGQPFDIELSFKAAANDTRWLRIIGNPSREERGMVVIGATWDITERKHQIDTIQFQASHDALTGLPNRRHFNSMLEARSQNHRTEEQTLAVLFIDLDNFKPVNDNLGHQAGDELLRQVAQRIQQCVRGQDVVARYSGDEFTAVLQLPRDQITPQQVAQRILDAINKPYAINNNQVYCGASIGISVYPKDGHTAEELISSADQAMYQVKKSGRNSWQSYSAELNARSERKHYLHSRLAAALENDQLQVFYQPIVRLADARVVKCEALVRWFDDGKPVPPDEFISLAEEVGLISKIDQFVLNSATKLLSGENSPVELSVNVSPLIFSAQDNSLRVWMQRIFEASRDLKISVEITERLLTEDSERALTVLKRLRERGVRIAIDDFGTGYSSLSYLTKFPIDIIKIDRSFVNQLGDNITAMTLTNAILGLSQKLSLEVIAEGIETQAQCNYLKQRGCELGQGYLLGKPMPQADFLELLRQQAPNSPQPDRAGGALAAADRRV